MDQRLTLITLGVSDLERSRKFYNEVFGWKPADHSDDAIVFYTLNGFSLALFQENALAEDAGVPAKGSGFRRITLAHNVGSEAAVDQLFAELESRGAKAIKRPQKVFWGGYSSYISDPDGILWEIAYNPFMQL